MADLPNAPDAINIGQITTQTLATIETRVQLATLTGYTCTVFVNGGQLQVMAIPTTPAITQALGAAAAGL